VTLQLAYDHPPAPSSAHSLARMLSRPQAASTQLNILLQKPAAEATEQLVDASLHALVSALPAEVCERVESLDIPILYVMDSLELVCVALPRLRVLILRVQGVPKMCANGSSSSDDDHDGDPSSLLSTLQLNTLILRNEPGQSAAIVFDGHKERLDFSSMPALAGFVLHGPIVKMNFEDNEAPFLLPPNTKVRLIN